MPSTCTASNATGRPKPMRGEDRQLVRGIDAVDVERRIGFGVAQLLRIGEHFGELAAALAHLRQDVVAGAVEDAGDAADAVRGQPLAQRLDHRNAAGHRRLERQRHAALLGRGGKCRAMHRQHRLVGGDHRLAGRQRRLHQCSRRPIGSADQLHHHVRPPDRRPAPPGPRTSAGPTATPAVARAITGGHGGHRDRPAGARGNDVGIIAQQLQDAAADGAQAGNGNREGVGHGHEARCCEAGSAGIGLKS